MSGGITIALDAMGGEHAPDMVLRGADMALQRYPDLRFMLFGREEALRPLLAKLPRLAVAVTLAPHQRDGAGRRQAVLGASLRTAIEHATGDRRSRRRKGRRRRLRRQHRCADGDGEIRAEDLARDRPAGYRVILSDPARRERDARSRRQCRMRCRQPGSVRAAGRCLCPHRARSSRAHGWSAQCRFRGSEGQRRRACRQPAASRGADADSFPRVHRR